MDDAGSCVVMRSHANDVRKVREEKSTLRSRAVNQPGSRAVQLTRPVVRAKEMTNPVYCTFPSSLQPRSL